MKRQIETYVISGGNVTMVPDWTLVKEDLLLIVDVTTNTILYNFADATRGGTLTGYTLALAYTTGLTNSNKLLIYAEDGQSEASDAQLQALKRIVKLLESGAVTDAKLRQRVVVEGIGTNNAASTELNATMPVSGTVALSNTYVNINGQTPNGGLAPTLSTTAGYTAVWEGPVDQRWRIIDAARTAFATGTRPNLSFNY